MRRQNFTVGVFNCDVVYKSLLTYKPTYVPTFPHTHLPTQLHTHLPTYTHTHTPTLLKAVVLGSIVSEFEAPKFHSWSFDWDVIYKSLLTCTPTYLPTFPHPYLPSYLPTHTHTHLPTHTPSYTTTYQPTYTHTYLPIHTTFLVDSEPKAKLKSASKHCFRLFF